MDGREQDMEHVESTRRDDLPVVSLYGETKDSLRPRPQDLEDLDAVVVDLQDVGSRYYTFVYTLSFVMEEAARAGLPVVLLDRPNPIGGESVEGPVLEPSMASFVGRYPIPVRHGLTIGELARLFNREFGIGCDLRVVRMEGWRRGLHFDRTGLPWVTPSPNMPTLSTALVYPGACLVEGTALSEGRGTTTPFELLGAPGLNGHHLLQAMHREELPGVLFRAASFRPMFQKHAGEDCHGVQCIVTDRERFRPFETFLVLIRECRRLLGGEFAWREEPYEFETDRLAIDLLLGRPDLRPMIEAGAPLEQLRSSWEAGLARFAVLRRGYLLYP